MATFPDDFTFLKFVRMQPGFNSPASRMPFSTMPAIEQWLTWVRDELEMRGSLDQSEQRLLNGLIEAARVDFEREEKRENEN